MRILLATTLFFAGISAAFAQKPAIPLNETTKKAEYTEVVQAEGVTQSQLYDRALGFFKSYFPNPASVLKVQDPATGEVSGQHGIYIYKNMPDGTKHKVGQVRYAVQVLVKEGRYKYTINDIFKLESPKVYLEEWLDESDKDVVNRFEYARQVDSSLQELIVKLKAAMKTAPEVKKEDW